LNEESNIAQCLASVQRTDPEEIVVIDGGSTDATVAIARASGANVIEAGRIGLAKQRRQGYLSTSCPYVAFVDADDRLEANWLEVLLSDVHEGHYSALQSQLRAKDPHNFWTRGWNDYFRESVQPTPSTNMVGRPALVSTKALRMIEDDPGMIIEDTEMSRTFEQLGLRQGIGHALSYRLCPDTYAGNSGKWQGYGRGYRQFIQQHPDRRRAILRHILWTIPIARSIRPLFRGNLSQPVFGVIMAGWILRGYLDSQS